MPVTRVVVDGRWDGDHGIGRFAREVVPRLPWERDVVTGAHPVSLRGLAELDLKVRRSAADWFFSPGYCVPVTWRRHAAITLHDLIHLDVQGEAGRLRGTYYDRFVRPFARRADVLLTVSEFSKQRIVEWTGRSPDDVVVVGNGVDEHFFGAAAPDTDRAPYVLHVGNRKPHKNLPRLFAAVGALPDVHLALTGAPDEATAVLAREHGLEGRVDHLGHVAEADLPGVYAGAAAVAVTSTYEGFGLAALEGMAVGVPVVASGTTSLPEVVGDAGLLVDPLDVGAITAALEQAVGDHGTRRTAAERGPERARRFTWASVSGRVSDAISSRS